MRSDRSPCFVLAATSSFYLSGLLALTACTDRAAVQNSGTLGAMALPAPEASTGAKGVTPSDPSADRSVQAAAGGRGSAESMPGTALPIAAGPGGTAVSEGGTGAPVGLDSPADAGVVPAPVMEARCQPASDPTIPPLGWTPIASGLEQPIYVTAAPGDDTRLFVIEKPGRIRLIRDGELLEDAFLDISDRVQTSVEEMGLLGLAFHPRYAENGRFYLTYSSDPQGGTNPAHTEVLAEFQARDPEHADTSERRVLTVAKPQGNHNGGNLQFGADGTLYYGVGDGGGFSDEHGSTGNGQARDTFLGKLLRIDVDGRGAGPDGQYAIPAGNFVERDPNALPEIWSIGLRNPWRFSFDACNGDLYIGDVGESTREEVDFVPGAEKTGRNFGWRLMEAETCFNPAGDCDAVTEGLTLPITSYGRSVGQCIIGGYVYRGSAIPALRGTYLYGDYESAVFFALRAQGGGLAAAPIDITANVNPDKAIDQITSFGQDNAGELYLTTFTGQLFRLDPR
jgi:glucose/arabinose dehydrogenase